MQTVGTTIAWRFSAYLHRIAVTQRQKTDASLTPSGPCVAPSISSFNWGWLPEKLSPQNNNKTPSSFTIAMITNKDHIASHCIPPHPHHSHCLMSLFFLIWSLCPIEHGCLGTSRLQTITKLPHHSPSLTLSCFSLLSNTTVYSITTDTNCHILTHSLCSVI